MSIDTFKSMISKKGGLAKANRFQVFFTPPGGSLLNINPETLVGEVVSTGSVNVKNLINDPRDISLLCETVSLPGRAISTIDYELEKQVVKIPYTTIDDDVTMTFLLTNDYFVKKMFDQWSSSIIDMNTYRVGYKKNYQTDIVIQQLDQNNIPRYGVRLENAYPINVGAIALDNNSENAIQKLEVSFAYDKYIPEGTVGSSFSALESVTDQIRNIF